MLGAGPHAPGLEGDDQCEHGGDAAEDLERRQQAERRDQQAGQDRGQRQRRVGDDIESGHHRAAVLRRDGCGQDAERAEERHPKAGAANDRAGEEERTGVHRCPEDDDHPSGGEHH